MTHSLKEGKGVTGVPIVHEGFHDEVPGEHIGAGDGGEGALRVVEGAEATIHEEEGIVEEGRLRGGAELEDEGVKEAAMAEVGAEVEGGGNGLLLLVI
jgi:hypothetical protein